jgi:hypothetical protein
MCESAPKGDGFLTKSCARRSRSLKLEWGLSVPALTFEPSASPALANALASSLLRKVSIARACERFPTRSLGSNETYQVSLDPFGTGAWLHFPSLSSATFAGPGPFKSSTWIAKEKMHILRALRQRRPGDRVCPRTSAFASMRYRAQAAKYWSSEGCFFALLRSGRPPSLLG